MDQQLVVALLGSAGLFSFLGVLVSGITKVRNGTAGREKIRNAGLKEQRNEAWADAEKERDRADCERARADLEAHNRRLTEEYASQLRRDCTEHGMTDRELRPWPTLRKPPPEQEPS